MWLSLLSAALWLQSRLPTTGGNISIVGNDFGDGMSANSTLSLAEWMATTGRGVPIDGVPCRVYTWSDSEIVCLAAEGTNVVRAPTRVLQPAC